MQPTHQQSRIDLAELRARIVKKLGPEGSKQYIYYLNRFLNLKLSKVEFDKLCHIILGRDNIPLHNHFIHSILKNACSAKAPPPASSKNSSADGYLQNGSYTNMLPVSPRKTRTGALNRKSRNALGSNAQANFAAPYTRLTDFNVMENGDLSRGFIQHAENENGISGPTPADMSVSRRSQDGLGPFVRSPLRAPLGVPLCPVSISGAHRGASRRCIGTCNDSLLDSQTLREQMEQIATSHGLEGVSLECANMLNHGLDSYMKGLLKSCIHLVGPNLGNELPQNNIQNTHKQLTYMKPINGVKTSFQYQMRNSERKERKISLQEFRVAMEMSPSQLGEDWPLLLEKICVNEFDE